MEKINIGIIQRFIIWRENEIQEKHFILMLSFLVGLFTAFAALILKYLIHLIQNFLTDNFDSTEANYLYLVYPVVGIFLAGLFVRNIVKDDISHGVTKILYAISRRQGRIKRHNIWSSTIASAITIGFVDWKDVHYIEIINIMGQEMIAIHLKDENQYLLKVKNPIKKWLLKTNSQYFGGMMNISANALNASTNELYKSINKYFQKYKEIISVEELAEYKNNSNTETYDE